ncbi:hypothetical protein D9611_004483 [Ephemerocybe angulata]|uniref:UFSP1/2/DUB catalytic domain-containing protein n=1 Tax=Ephemerocybe angulata TaxID=980116 RepID=A0A8H5F5F4_9AGAR|nr:hypothetical protein D9611_004483 [Tulosesus angulatus]
MPPGASKASGSSSAKRMKNSIKSKIFPTETDVFWHPAMTTPPPRNYTPGFIPILKASLAGCHSRGEIRKAVLCYDKTIYVQKELWNASWGCGYLNFLMACAVLMVQPFEPMYFPLLDEPIPPGIRNLQQWIEIAWDAGFDPEGKEQLTKLMGTRQWIGTSDIWVALSSRGIPAELVDFDSTKGNGVQTLVDWTVNYFTPKTKASDTPRSAFDALKGSNAVVSTDIMPFILQHSGHSRLIVGYETDKQGKVNLLTFDCGQKLPKPYRDYALSKFPPPPSDLKSEAGSSTLKRRASTSLGQANTPKRSRSGDGGDNDVEIVAEFNVRPEVVDDDIVITGFTSPHKPKPTPKAVPKPNITAKDLQPFRISAKALGRHKQYQILYFPMTSPLTDQERAKRKVPTSTKAS